MATTPVYMETPQEYACRVHAHGKYQRTVIHTGSKERCPHHIKGQAYHVSLTALLRRLKKDPRLKVAETDEKFTLTWSTP